MTHLDWIFLTELIVLPGIWILVCAWNDQFNNKKEIECAARKNILQEYKDKVAAEANL